MKTSSVSAKLASYLQSHSILHDSSESFSGKNIAFSVSLPIERYYLFKEISSRYNASMSQIVNVALNGFDAELLCSLDREASFEIARNADAAVTADIAGEPVSYWYSKVSKKASDEHFSNFCKMNPQIPEDRLYEAYQDCLAESAKEELF